MKEQSYSIGHSPRLVGIYTYAEEKNTKPADDPRPTILLLNSGLLNRIGPFRHYVRLAREFSKQGFNTCRFDLSGIGDSERRSDNRTHDEHAVDDVYQVMNFLEQQHNHKTFLVMGICTGADNAHKAMVRHKNIVGAVSIDGYSYPTLKYYLNYYGEKLFHSSSWMTLVRTFSEKLTCLFRQDKQDSKFESFDFEWILPKKSKTEADYKLFIKRKVFLLSIFTASWPYNYNEQLADSLPNIEFGENIQSVYLENAEHTFPLQQDRNELTSVIVSWLNHCFANKK